MSAFPDLWSLVDSSSALSVDHIVCCFRFQGLLYLVDFVAKVSGRVFFFAVEFCFTSTKAAMRSG